MNWYKQADFMGRDPYKVDFASEEAKAKRMDTDSLFGALSDAIEASQISANQGKYTDQASVYRKELLRRKISIEEQDARVKEIPSLHSNYSDDANGDSRPKPPNEMDNPSCRVCGQKKHWENFSKDNETCDECLEEDQNAQIAGKNFIDSGESQNYPEFD